MLRNTSPSGRNLRTVWWIPTQPYRGAHFATFPEKIPELCILAGTSELGACAECGTPWTREVRAVGGAIGRAQKLEAPLVSGRAPVADAPGWHDGSYRRVDLGFRKRCSCETIRTVPCLVLDPFAGSGTVLAVARRLGRRSIGIELNPDYVFLARRRSAGETRGCCRTGGCLSMTRVALYARVSTKEQSTEAQVSQLTAYCQARGWAEISVFRDDGISGVRDNRPELDRLRERLASGDFDTIVVSKMDRLGRSLGMILRFWDDAEAAGARVIVIDQGIDTSTPSGRLQRNMLAALAEFERELILERTQAGIARARALGKKFGAPRRIPESVAREVWARRAQRESLRMISQRMNLKLGAVRSVLRRECTSECGGVARNLLPIRLQVALPCPARQNRPRCRDRSLFRVGLR